MWTPKGSSTESYCRVRLEDWPLKKSIKKTNKKNHFPLSCHIGYEYMKMYEIKCVKYIFIGLSCCCIFPLR